MIINVDEILKVGATFPTAEDAKRYGTYLENKALFDGRYEYVFPTLEQELTDQWSFDGEVVSVFEPITIKFCMLITKKFNELIFGKLPTVVHTKNEKLDKEISKILKRTDFWKFVSKAFTDCEIYGNGILYTYNSKDIEEINNVRTDGKAVTTESSPMKWIPVVNQGDQHRLKGNIIYHYEVDEPTPNNYEYRIVIKYYTNGKLRTINAKCSKPNLLNVCVIQEILEDKTVDIIQNNDPIKVLTNFNISEESVFGRSSFDTYRELLGAITRRLTLIDKVLNKHTIPTLTGPASALSTDKNGKKFFKRGAYIALSPADSSIKVEYLTWDGKLESAFEELDRLVGFLYQMAETGSAFIDNNLEKDGFAESARALKIRHSSPIAKANFWIMQNENAILEAVEDICRISGIDIDWTDLELNWKPNLPEDELEKAQIFQQKVNAGFSKVEEMIRSYDMDREGAVSEFEAHLEESNKSREISIQNSTNYENNEKTVDKNNSNEQNKDDEVKSAETIRKSNDQLATKK